MRRLSRLTPVIILIAVGLAAAPLATAATSGSANTTSVEMKRDVDLNPNGKPAAFVTINYTCQPTAGGGYVPLSTITLTDSAGNSNTAFFPPICDGTKHSGVVGVGGLFATGDGSATALVCGLDCNLDTESVTIGVR